MKKVILAVMFLLVSATPVFAGPLGAAAGLVVGPISAPIACPLEFGYAISNEDVDQFTRPFNGVPVLTQIIFGIEAAEAILLASAVSIIISPILGAESMSNFETKVLENRAYYADFFQAIDVCYLPENHTSRPAN